MSSDLFSSEAFLCFPKLQSTDGLWVCPHSYKWDPFIMLFVNGWLDQAIPKKNLDVGSSYVLRDCGWIFGKVWRWGNIVSSVFLLLPSATVSNFLVLLLVFKNWAHSWSSPTKRYIFFPHCSPLHHGILTGQIYYISVYLSYVYMWFILKDSKVLFHPLRTSFAPFIVHVEKSMF